MAKGGSIATGSSANTDAAKPLSGDQGVRPAAAQSTRLPWLLSETKRSSEEMLLLAASSWCVRTQEMLHDATELRCTQGFITRRQLET